MSLFLFHFLAFFFFLRPYSDLSRSFFNSPLLPSLSMSLPLLPWCWDVFQPVCMTEENEKTYTAWFLVWVMIFTSLFFPLSVLLYLFCTDTCQDGNSSLSLVWHYPCCVYIQSALTLAQKLFFCNNRGIVKKAKKLSLRFSCLPPSNFDLIWTCNLVNRFPLRSIINMQVAIFPTPGQE